MEPLIEFSEVGKSFNKKTVFDRINLKIFSGSGKSTLMKLLLGVYKPDQGEIFFKGKNITKNSFYLRKQVGLTTQENSFYEKLTVYENMLYYSNLYNVNKKGKELRLHIQEVLNSVRLGNSANFLAGNISGGMKRRLDFALSLIYDPELLILDEPTTGLDPVLVKEFWQLVKEVNKKGKTIVVISHHFPELKENCNKISIIYNGKIDTFKITKNIDLFKEFSKRVK